MILTPLTLPPMALALLGLKLEIDLLAFMLRLGALLGGALLVSLIVRRVVPRPVLDRNASAIDGIAVRISANTSRGCA